MRIFSLRRLGLVIVLVATIGLLAFITTHVKAITPRRGGDNVTASARSPDWSLAETVMDQVASQTTALDPAVPTPPEKDPCLHCHIIGEEKGLWTPLARWSLFGTLGLTFVYGVYRSASVWTKRVPWVPLTARAAQWVDERYEVSEPLSKVLNKPVPKYALRWWYCLGGITAFLFVVQGLTGIMLAFYYQPTPDTAFASIQYIESQVYLGAAIRSVHHWAANGMIVMCIAHMLRVFIMGAFKPPRELNWMSGVLLLLLTLGFGLTGYLLPWDQRAYWATTVATEIAGSLPVVGDLLLVFARVGWEVNAQTLSRFYTLHIIGLPLLTVALMGAHFLMVRRQGIAKPL